MTVILFEYRNEPKTCQFNLSFISISINESERGLFSIYRNWSSYEINILFFKFYIN